MKCTSLSRWVKWYVPWTPGKCCSTACCIVNYGRMAVSVSTSYTARWNPGTPCRGLCPAWTLEEPAARSLETCLHRAAEEPGGGLDKSTVCCFGYIQIESIRFARIVSSTLTPARARSKISRTTSIAPLALWRHSRFALDHGEYFAPSWLLLVSKTACRAQE